MYQIIRSLTDPPTTSSPPSPAAAACLWEVLAYALCKGCLSQQEGERLFTEAAAAISWAVTYRPSAPSAAGAASAAFQTFSATFGSFWKWISGGASPLPAEYRANLLKVVPMTADCRFEPNQIFVATKLFFYTLTSFLPSTLALCFMVLSTGMICSSSSSSKKAMLCL